jgi:hypothetical protein
MVALSPSDTFAEYAPVPPPSASKTTQALATYRRKSLLWFD